MLLPYATDNPPARRPVMTWTLIAVHIALAALAPLLATKDAHGQTLTALTRFGIVPAHFQPLTLFTYFLFHEGYGHLLTNLFYLWVFGGSVEEAVGRGRFLLLYVAGGVLGGLLQLLASALLPPWAGLRPIVGASAACATLVGVFAVRYYRARLAFVGLPWRWRPHVVTVVLLFLGFEIFAGLHDLWAGSALGSVAHWAHVGGFVFGLAWGQIFRLDVTGQRAYLRADVAQAIHASTPGVAIKQLEAQLSRTPNSPTLRVELARAWLMLGDTEQAAQHFLQAIGGHLARNERAEAAVLYAEMREHGLQTPSPATGQLFPLGNALEEIEQHALAAETLRAVSIRRPNTPEAETALLKVVHLYATHLDRRDEAKDLLRFFMERYPQSQWRAFAEDLRRSLAV